MRLPDLLFGVATSDHQAEAYEPEFADFRDNWEKLQGQTPRGKATDFWNRYPEDIGLARDLGCKLFRFSISWSRVEPRRGEFAAEVLDHVRGDKVIAFKKRRRKNSRRKRGHRQQFSLVRITEILTEGRKPSQTPPPRPRRQAAPQAEAGATEAPT